MMRYKKLLPIGIGALLVAILIISKTLSNKYYLTGLQDDNKVKCDSITDRESEDSCDICHDESPAIPMFVKNLVKGGEWYADTICAVKGKTYFIAREGCSSTAIIYDDERVYIEDPTLRIDSVSSGHENKFYVSVIENYKLIDFNNPQSVKSLSTLTRNLPSFTRFRKDTTALKGCAYFSLTADFPTESVVHADEIRRWLVNQITLSDTTNDKWKYKGDINNPEQVAKHASNMFFDYWKELDDDGDECPMHVFTILNFKAKVANKRYVTYLKFAHEYEGGAHGYYTESLHSYDHVHNQEIDFNYLFIPECKLQLHEMLLKIADRCPMYKDCEYNINDYVCVTDKNGNPTGELQFPQPGLSEEGIVFSFQPYDICYFAAGTFHFTIPYDKVKHLLTPQGRWCIGIR